MSPPKRGQNDFSYLDKKITWIPSTFLLAQQARKSYSQVQKTTTEDLTRGSEISDRGAEEVLGSKTVSYCSNGIVDSKRACMVLVSYLGESLMTIRGRNVRERWAKLTGITLQHFSKLKTESATKVKPKPVKFRYTYHQYSKIVKYVQ